MFLRYLSDTEYEERFWPFVFRLESVLAGIVQGSARRIVSLSPDERYDFLFDALGACLNTQNGTRPEGWWPEPTPSIEWFDGYLRHEYDFIVHEALRLAPLSDAERREQAESAFDKKKVRERAHLSEAFKKFLLPHSEPHEH